MPGITLGPSDSVVTETGKSPAQRELMSCGETGNIFMTPFWEGRGTTITPPHSTSGGEFDFKVVAEKGISSFTWFLELGRAVNQAHIKCKRRKSEGDALNILLP